MTRTITAQQIKPGMKIKHVEFGWEYIAEVSEVKNVDNPDKDYVAIWAKAEFGARGGLDCIKKHKVVEVLEEAPLPSEPSLGSIARVAGRTFHRFGKTDFSWYDLSGAGSKSWREINDMGEVEVLFDMATAKPKYKVGDKVETLPPASEDLRGYVFKQGRAQGDYAAIGPRGRWGYSLRGLEAARKGEVLEYIGEPSDIECLGPFTVVATPESE